ncbi:RICIN domain-containing protein [Streptomyces sp. NPDC001552]|uniref:RICIN domain-containing protein n=1 Tax=Streptomyces sp. NPDC001552 TaxID=3364587 RepID=UPI003697E960
MTASTPHGRETRRMTACLLVGFSLLAVAGSPLTAGTAFADDSTCEQTSVLACLDLSPVLLNAGAHLGLEDEGSSADGNGLFIREGSPTPGKWSFKPNDDGSFQIVNNRTGKCVESRQPDQTSALFYPELWTCSGEATQKFYVHKDENRGNFRIRNVSNDKCLDAQRLTNDRNSEGPMELYGCHAGGTGQTWLPSGNRAGSSPAQTAEALAGNAALGLAGVVAGIVADAARPPDPAAPVLDALATQYALKQFDSHSSVIKRATYAITDYKQKAARGPYKIVSVANGQADNSPFCTNASGPSGGNMSCGMSWSQSEANTISYSHTVGVSAKVGVGKESPVQAEVAFSYQHTWGKSTTTTQTSGRDVRIDVPPGQTAWLARALAYKTVTGTWTITNDLGRTWTATGTATMPVEGVDGQYSNLIKCTTDSLDPGCMATLDGHDPAGH